MTSFCTWILREGRDHFSGSRRPSIIMSSRRSSRETSAAEAMQRLDINRLPTLAKNGKIISVATRSRSGTSGRDGAARTADGMTSRAEEITTDIREFLPVQYGSRTMNAAPSIATNNAIERNSGLISTSDCLAGAMAG